MKPVQPLYDMWVTFNGRVEWLHEIYEHDFARFRSDPRYVILSEPVRLAYGSEVHDAKERHCDIWGGN